ncbi:Astacin domain-containing protein, partial [Meloidogyne graminicola]
RGTKTFISTNSQENDDILIELEPINEEENNENKIINNLTTSSELQQLDDQQKLKKQNIGTSIRPASHDVYLWPSMTEHEKTIIRNAFFQIHRRTCIKFNELNYKPWYHAERWTEGKPYVVIRKSKKFSGYSDNNIEDVNRRSLIYLSEQSLNIQNINNSRGMVMEQLLKFMGYREEFLRPDAPSYIQPIISDNSIPKNTPKFSNEQLIWPFDPESITIPSIAREWFQLTIYCQARRNADIGAGQRTGLLTRWDAVKLNSMYCPQSVGYADPRMGPCVVPRKPKI